MKVAVLAALATLPYLFSLDGEFVFDDTEAVVTNPDLADGASLGDLFIHDFWGADIKSNVSHKSYRPLTVLTFRLNKALDGGRLIAFHFKLTNLFLHIFVTILTYKVFLVILQRCRLRRCCLRHETHLESSSVWKDEAFLLAVIFAVHPVHVEAVAGVVGRSDVLAAFVYLLVIYIYNLSLEKFDESSRNFSCIAWLYFFLSSFLTLIAMFCKETGITALALCFVFDFITEIDFCISRRKPFLTFTFRHHESKECENSIINNDFFKYQNKARVYFIVRLCLLIFLSSCFLYIRWAIMNFEGPTFQDVDNPAAFSTLFPRVATYNYLYFLNTLILLWPQWLCFDWSMGCVPLIETIFDIRLIFVFIIWCYFALMGYNILKPRDLLAQKRYMIISTSFFIIPYLPASNILMPVGFVIAERILYIPSIGFHAIIIKGFSKLLSHQHIFLEKLLKSCFVWFVIIATIKTIQRSHEWISEKPLYMSALNVCPLNAKVHYNIGKNAGDNNELNLAENSYIEALRLNPKYYQAMNNLANLYKDQKRFVEAEKLLKLALDIKLDFPAAWMNLGIVLSNMNKLEDAEQAYLLAIKYRRKYPDCYYNLGNLYLEQKKHNLALQAWSKATELNPSHIVAWSNTLALLDNTGQIDRATKLIPIVLHHLSHVPAINFNIANLLGKQGKYEEAEKHFIKAIELKKSNPSPLYYTNLGVLYHRWKKNDRAIDMYQKALSLDPAYKSAHDNLQSLIKNK